MYKKALSTLAALLLLGSVASPAQAATSLNDQTSHSSAMSSTEDSRSTSSKIDKAIDRAFKGDAATLAGLLETAQADKVQTALRERLTARGDFAFAKPNATRPNVPGASGPGHSKAKGVAGKDSIVSTGQYEYFCTGYNGVTMGWFGKPILACHGWLDTYISGNHVAHYNPDLIPRGKPITVGCFVSAASGVVTVLSLPAGGIVGWAKYGIGVLLSSAGIVISCP